MRTLYFVCVCLSMCVAGWGQVSMKIYEADGVTPFDYRDIMVGTELTVVVESTSAMSWCGGIFIAGQDRALGLLSGINRDPDIPALNTCTFNDGQPFGEPGDWTGSHLPAAGTGASVITYRDSFFWGFDLQSDNTAITGDWFVIDYSAIDVGSPVIGLYDYSISFFEPIETITITQIPTRDFDGNKKINYGDFSKIHHHWMATDCDPNTDWCEQSDISRNGTVNLVDLDLFDDFWLED